MGSRARAPGGANAPCDRIGLGSTFFGTLTFDPPAGRFRSIKAGLKTHDQKHATKTVKRPVAKTGPADPQAREDQTILMGAAAAGTKGRTTISLRSNAAWGLAAAGFVMLLGSFIDSAILWVLQQQATPQWEFVAASNTLEGLPRYTVALGFLFAALAIGDVRSIVPYRLLAALLALVGIASVGLGLLLVTDYMALARVATDNQAAVGALRQTSIKAGALSLTFAVVLLPAAVLVWRRPKG